MAAADNLRVDPQVMQGFAQGLTGAAESLRNRLSELDGQVGEMLGGWRGGAGDAYGSAWELWHRGAAEVELGLSMLAKSVAQADKAYQQNDAGSAQTMRQVHGG
ncbi:WXG100 family type VII secretion target [Mycobacterium rhizamassiliense]|jgi:WXG100 family type VII secretion target|nr:WXG100 family type VII secretion target [Mycobacterium rhizamassiliense]